MGPNSKVFTLNKKQKKQKSKNKDHFKVFVMSRNNNQQVQLLVTVQFFLINYFIHLFIYIFCLKKNYF